MPINIYTEAATGKVYKFMTPFKRLNTINIQARTAMLALKLPLTEAGLFEYNRQRQATYDNNMIEWAKPENKGTTK